MHDCSIYLYCLPTTLSLNRDLRTVLEQGSEKCPWTGIWELSLNRDLRIASLIKEKQTLHIQKSHQICNLQSNSRTFCFGNVGHKKRKFAEKRNILIPAFVPLSTYTMTLDADSATNYCHLSKPLLPLCCNTITTFHLLHNSIHMR